jgi:tetratricopeptide (TPR) repeat protein
LAQRRKPNTAPSEAPRKASSSWIAPTACAALAFAVYANSLANGFIVDDQFQILANPVVTGARNLFSAFGSGVWTFLGYRGNYYRPLQFLVYGSLYRTFGAYAMPFHLFMASLHAINTAMVAVLARRLVAARASALPARAAWIAAMIFAVHPIHTEAVDWIAALPDVLITAFALAGLCLFTAHGAKPSMRQALGHAALYLAALLTKETGVMIVVLYLACQWFYGKRGNRAMYAGMAGAFALYLALRIDALGGLAPAQQAFFHLSAPAWVMSAIVIAAQYLLALVAPVELNFFHVLHAANAPSLALLLALALIAAAAWAAIHFRRSQPLVTVALVWIAAPLLPAMNLGGVGQNVFAERYLYLPSVGLVILAAAAWSWIPARRPGAAWAIFAAVALVFSIQTVQRNRDWSDDFTLLQVTERQSPDSGYIHNLMAGAWVQRDQFQRALDEQRLAVKYDPESPILRKNLGNILLGFDPAAAAREFEAAARMLPNAAESHSNLGLAYEALGRREEALAEYRRALALDPHSREAAAGASRLSPR